MRRHPFARLWKSFSDRKLTPIRRAFRPQLQRLEEVIAPANAVLVTAVGGTLTISSQETGPADFVQNVTITGNVMAPGEFSISGFGTTINGTASATGIRNIVVNMK